MFEVDPTLLLDWLKNNSPWFVPVALFLFFLLKHWGKLNWDALNEREKKPESFEWALVQLKENSWGRLYINSLSRLLDIASGWIGDQAKLNRIYTTSIGARGIIYKTFGVNPFTSESYEKCLRLAFLYPVLSFFIGWAMGGNGVLGSFDWLGHEVNTLTLWQRWLVIVNIILIVIGLTYVSVNKVLVVIFIFVIVSVFSYVVLFLGKNIGLISIAFSLSIVFSVVNREKFSLFIAICSIIASVVLIFYLFDFAKNYIYSELLVFAFFVIIFYMIFTFNKVLIFLQNIVGLVYGSRNFWLFQGVGFLVVGYIAISFSQSPLYMIFVLFWLLLPVVNAPLDWLSLGVTRGLLQAVRLERHGGWMALGWGLLDLVLALAFLFIIAGILVSATALGNVSSGKVLVNLDVIFFELRADTWNVNHWWVYFMMLSALVPTLLHFAVVGGAATLWLPKRLRERIADNLEQNHYKISAAWIYLTFTPAIGFVVVPALLMMLLYFLVTTNGAWLGGHLLDWAEWLALLVSSPAVVQP